MSKAELALFGEYVSECGYCKKSQTHANKSYSVAFFEDSMSPESYQHLICKGWRRSGMLFYKPINEKTCCPLITIRTDVDKFRLVRKSHKRILKRISKEINVTVDDNDFTGTISNILQFPDIFSIITVSASFDAESFELYKKYQILVHKDMESNLTRKSYDEFLCNSPLTKNSSRHQKYFLRKKLIAVGVIDLLPDGLSSVYFFYDPDYEKLSLGTFSSLYEIYYGKEVTRVHYYYMGYYIKNCQKMSYKARYLPCYLLDKTCTKWIPFEDATFDSKGRILNN